VIKVGDRVPDFELKDQYGNTFSLKDHLGKGKIVLYFYPKDDTPGCTKEACAFRDSYEVFTDAGAEVVGISSDDIDSHRRFSEKHKLPFILLSDNDSKVREKFGVPKTLGLLTGRTTYIVDENGIVLHIFNSQIQIKKHIDEAIKIITGNDDE